MSIQVIVTTCDNYAWLMPGFFQQWNKYCGLPGMVVCEQVATKVPAGWSHFRAGYQTSEKHWAGNLKLSLAHTHSPVVLLMLDDYWLYQSIDTKRIVDLAGWMASDYSIDKIDLTNDRMGFAHTDWDNNFVRSLPMAQYLTSLQPALWRTAFLRRCLDNPGWNPWQFELSGTTHMQGQQHKILGCKVPAINYANIVLKGKASQAEISKLSPEDKASLVSIGAFKGRDV